MALRQIGKGRIVYCGIDPVWLYGKIAPAALGGIVGEKGMKGVPSHWNKLFLNSLNWLAETSRGNNQLGGATTDKSLFINPYMTQFVAPQDLSKLDVYKRQAPDLVTNTYWNGFTVTHDPSTQSTSGTLLASNGSSGTSVTLSLSTVGDLWSFDAAPNNAGFAPALLNDVAYGLGGSTLDFTIGGLTDGGNYNLFFYTENGGYASGAGTYTCLLYTSRCV